MCVTCGCSDNSEVTVTNPQTGTHEHILADGTVISHSHHDHDHEHPHHPAEIHAQIHGNILQVEQNLLAKNNLLAAQNRGWLKGRKTVALNLVSSPGSGKTTLLKKINRLNIPICSTLLKS